MKKGIRIALITLAALLVCAAGAGAAGVYYLQKQQESGTYLNKTVINGEDVSGKTPAEAAQLLSAECQDGQVSLLEDGEEVFHASLGELGYAFDMEGLEKSLTTFLASEKTDIRTVFEGLMNGNSFSVEPVFTEDQKAFEKSVTAEALTAPRRENVNAKIFYYEKEEECRIRPEVQGTELKDEDLQAWLRGEIEAVLAEAVESKKASTGAASTDAAASDAAASDAAVPGAASDSKAAADPAKPVQKTAASGEAAGSASTTAEAGAVSATQAPAVPASEAPAAPAEKGEFDVVRTIPASLYIPPKITSENETLQKKCGILNKYAKEKITYVFGDKTKTLTFKRILNWLEFKDGELTVKEDKVRKYVRKLAEKYETRYMERTFTTTWGYEVTFPPGANEYGYTILEDLETQQLIQDILSGESVEREPVYQVYGPWGDPLYLKRSGTDDLAGTYVEVSISAQHMWYYVDGALLIESDVVTGDTTLGQDTATGVFPLAYKKSPDILRGGEGKKKYETKVQYWMPFYEGQGLHDAWWKTVFGGTEYIGNGSHGCVNLPPWVAEIVYNNIVPGTAIIIYY